MAISLSQYKQAGQQLATSKKLAEEYAKQQRKAKKRRGWSGLLGKIAGTGLGAGLASLFTVASGGILAPLLMAAGQFGGKKIGHELTRGMAAETTGLKGDVYGYGKGEAKTLAEGLREQMATDPLKEHGGFGQDVLQSYLTAGLAGELKGAGKAFTKEGKGLGQFLGVGGDFGTGMKGTGWERFKAGVGSAFDAPWGGEGDKGLIGIQKPPKSEDWGDWLSEEDAFYGYAHPQRYIPDTSNIKVSKEKGLPFLEQEEDQSWIPGFKEGGKVPKYYGGGNVAPTISEYFNKQGKTLGGSNKQSLAEMLGRK